MAIKQSDYAAGVKTVPVPDCAGEVAVARFEYVIGADLAVDDIIELGVLPAHCVPVDAIFYADEAGTATYNVGLMSGDVGSEDAGRTSGAELFSGAADATFTRLSLIGGLRLAASDKDRSIGVKVQTAGITAADQKVTLVLQYAANV